MGWYQRRVHGECITARDVIIAIMPASKKGSSKKAKKGGGSNVFDMFTQKQVAEFKEGYQIMDRDRDGVVDKADLRGTFDEIGRIVSDGDLDSMLADAPDPSTSPPSFTCSPSAPLESPTTTMLSQLPSAPSRRTPARLRLSSSAPCSWPSEISSPTRRSMRPSTTWNWMRTPA